VTARLHTQNEVVAGLDDQVERCDGLDLRTVPGPTADPLGLFVEVLASGLDDPLPWLQPVAESGAGGSESASVPQSDARKLRQAFHITGHGQELLQ
jgi:hypothetical protein